jgi:hypothetical protein
MSDETSGEQAADRQPDEDVEAVATEPPPGGDTDVPADEEPTDAAADTDDDTAQPATESEAGGREVNTGHAAERPARSAARSDGLPRTTTTGDPDLDVRKPGAGAVDKGGALDREREDEDVRGHPEDHGTLLPD